MSTSPRNSNGQYVIDKRRMRNNFHLAASSYDQVAVLQREVADRMLERLDLITLQPKRILDLGSGTGYCTRALAKRYPDAEIIALDIAPAMIEHTRSGFSWFKRWRKPYHFVCADAESLPFADGSFDMIFSSLAIQWCQDLDKLFSEFLRTLRKDGVLMFSSLGPDTLIELRSAWAQVDQATHVNAFIDMHDVGDAMIRAQLAEPVLDVENINLTYGSVDRLLKDLKTLGSRNATAGRARGLTGRHKIQAMYQAYEAFRIDAGLPATYEVVYGHAWCGETAGKQKRQGSGGEAGPGGEYHIPADALKWQKRPGGA